MAPEWYLENANQRLVHIIMGGRHSLAKRVTKGKHDQTCYPALKVQLNIKWK